ncbi:MAG: DUF4345 family protein [bacterium]
MIAARRVLVLGALVFGAIGGGCLVFPDALMRVVDIALTTATARVEIYAFYGGLQLGVAFFLGLCATRTDWLPLGLTALAALLGGLGLARLLGALFVADVRAIHLAFATLEIAGTATSLWALRRVRDVRSPLWF